MTLAQWFTVVLQREAAMEAFVRVVDAGIILWCGQAVAPGPTSRFQDNCATRGASGCAPITPFYPWVDTDRGGRNLRSVEEVDEAEVAARGARAVDPILITDQVARGLSPRECLCNLACDPFRRRSSVMSAAIFETDPSLSE